MTPQIAMLLAQDGFITGAVYALLAVAILLIFTVTRIIFVPQGEFVAFGALTMAALQAGKTPGTLWLLLAMSGIAAAMELRAGLREGDRSRVTRGLLRYGVLPCALSVAVPWLAPRGLPMPVQALMTLAVVVPLGPVLYRIAFQNAAQGSVLLLLIISVAAHLALAGFGLVVFGPEGTRTTPLSEASWGLGPLQISGQSLWVVGSSVAAILALFWFFNFTFRGKALKATAVNRVGAELMGISTTRAGSTAFTLAAGIGALSGLLIAPVTTVFYDTGFLIGLKGFVAAIIGGLVSYPLAAAGAVLVGLMESYASFWASSFKEVIVFTLILPVLLWRSLTAPYHDEDEE